MGRRYQLSANQVCLECIGTGRDYAGKPCGTPGCKAKPKKSPRALVPPLTDNTLVREILGTSVCQGDAHAEWIARYVARFNGEPWRTLGRCQEAAEEMAAAFDDLRLVRGHVHCPEPWGKRGHWWCVDPDGAIVDPTAGQFTGGILSYEEYEAGDDVRLGSCMDCGAGIWGSPDRGRVLFCSPECEASTAAYLNGGSL